MSARRTTYRRFAAMASPLLLALVLAAPAPAAAAGAPVQPGVSIESGGSFCTLSWIFQRIERDAAGNLKISLFASSAAHCFDEVGQEVNLADTSLGEPIERLGDVVFLGAADEPGRDYAFIEIDEDKWADVDPSLVGHPNIPTGVSEDAAQGDLIQFSGHGVGFHLSQPTREERVGVLNWIDAEEHGVTGAVTPGDSGGPVANITDGNTAFGIVNTVGAGARFPSLTVVQAGEGGANLSFVLADAAARGFSVELCVVGTPCGVPAGTDA